MCTKSSGNVISESVTRLLELGNNSLPTSLKAKLQLQNAGYPDRPLPLIIPDGMTQYASAQPTIVASNAQTAPRRVIVFGKLL